MLVPAGKINAAFARRDATICTLTPCILVKSFLRDLVRRHAWRRLLGRLGPVLLAAKWLAMTYREFRIVLIAACVALPAVAAGGKATEGMNRKVAGRVFLSSGDVMEVAYTTTHGESTAETTLSARDTSSGIVISVTEKADYVWMRFETTISDGKTLLELRTDLGYFSDKLPTPFQVKIGKDVYRVLAKPNALTDDQKKMQAAVAKLPAPFLAGVKHLIPVGITPDFSIASLAAAAELFDSPSEIRVTVTKRLEPEEIDALIRDATK